MEFKEILTMRQSVRSYSDKPVSEESLNRVLEAARRAPSAHNGQNWKFIVIKDPSRRQRMMKACNNQPMVAQAPAVIAAVALDPEWKMPCGVPSYAVDLGIAVEHMVLAAVDEGLGSCWIGAFSQEQVKQVLEIPSKYIVVGVLPIGYSNQHRAASQRKPIEDIVCYETFSE